MMKKKFSLSIPTPCSEKWESFTPTAGGGFCSSCNKKVIDFTKMTNQEILTFFQNKPSHACGRFRPEQLTTYSNHLPTTSFRGTKWIKASLLSLILTMVSKEGYSEKTIGKTTAQFIQIENDESKKASTFNNNHIVKGIVKDEEGQLLPAVSIYLKGTTIGTATNADGYFEFPGELKIGDVLVISYIGYETKEYKITKEAQSKLELVLILDYEIMTGEISVNEIYTPKPTGFNNLLQKLKKIF